MTNPLLLAFYLPQYHPIPENDGWWGRGFTEWTNVTRGRPLFRGHYQPRLPADLGFYDLRLPEARQAQADLAQVYGVGGFCYYHYWFHGRRLLERPFAEVLQSGRPDFPFCLCWANENWTRAWDGQERQVLAAQSYSVADHLAHIRSLLPAFADPRYVRIDGKPLFLVYRVNRIPDPGTMADVWRAEARRAGVGELYLCRVESFADERGDPAAVGFDAAVEFQPDGSRVGLHSLPGWAWLAAHPAAAAGLVAGRFVTYDYRSLPATMLAGPDPGYVRLPCVTPSWDNTVRRRRGATVFVHSTPAAYEGWLRGAVAVARRQPFARPVVFVNAWNEWAEGNHLEPDQKHGRDYLEATRRALAD